MQFTLTFRKNLDEGGQQKWVIEGDEELEEAWPVRLEQQGESHMLPLHDVPEFIRTRVEAMGYELVER